MKKALTPEAIKRLPIRAKPYKVLDVKLPGLFVRVQPSGIKSFNVTRPSHSSESIGKWPSMTLKMARTEAHAILSGAPRPEKPGAVATMTLNAFLDRYGPWLSGENRAGAADAAALRAQFAPEKKPERFSGLDLGSKLLRDITIWHVEQFKSARRKAGIKPATVKRDLERLRSAMNTAIEWRLAETNPVTDVKKVENDRARFLSPDEEKRLRAALAEREKERRAARVRGNAKMRVRGYETRPEFAADEFTDHLAPLTLLALNTGLRRGELFGLSWNAVDLERRRLQVTAATAKSGRTRYVPLNDEAAGVLEKLGAKIPEPRAGRVFPPLTHFKRSWASLLDAAKIKDFRFHDIRHHFASRLVMTGADLYTTQQLLGHSDSRMTARYAHLADEHKAAAVARLAKKR